MLRQNLEEVPVCSLSWCRTIPTMKNNFVTTHRGCTATHWPSPYNVYQQREQLLSDRGSYVTSANCSCPVIKYKRVIHLVLKYHDFDISGNLLPYKSLLGKEIYDGIKKENTEKRHVFPVLKSYRTVTRPEARS